jgi:serine/threonine-protein kinase
MFEARQSGAFLPEEDVLNWAGQLSDALIYLHGQESPILHRDIKPSNLKLTPSGLLKLVDFGLVKLLASGEVTITILQGQGTAIYTPLEQYGGDSGHTDVRTDIFSFGATLYHLLTNQPPLGARERFLHPNELVLPRQINPEISQRTEKAILWALSLHPDERPENVERFRQSLLGDHPIQPRISNNTRPLTIWNIFRSSLERTLLLVLAGLTVFSLILTLMH